MHETTVSMVPIPRSYATAPHAPAYRAQPSSQNLLRPSRPLLMQATKMAHADDVMLEEVAPLAGFRGNKPGRDYLTQNDARRPLLHTYTCTLTCRVTTHYILFVIYTHTYTHAYRERGEF